MARHSKKPSDYSLEELISALNLFHGDVAKAAQYLECSPTSLSTYVYEVEELRALFMREVANVEPTGDEILRDVKLPIGNSGDARDAKAILAQNMKIMTDGLRASGIKEETIEKLETFQKFEAHAGSFLVGSIDIMHRMMVYTATSLFEQAELIKSRYLDNPNLPVKEKLSWQRMYNQVSEQMHKSYDRVLQGTEVMIKMTVPDKEEDKKRKRPGFAPLNEKKALDG